jgi:hypothetical protein
MYICGLKDYICSEIKLWKTKTIEDDRHATKIIGQKNKFNRPSFTSLDKSNKYSNEKSNKYSTYKFNKYVPPHLREGESRQHDSDKKWENKCRYCGDKWSPGNRCNTEKLYTCEAKKESDTFSSDSYKEIKDEYDVPSTNPKEAMPKISLDEITRITQPQTLKIRGHVKKENVAILIDTWNTHNFIDINVAKRLNLFVYSTEDKRVIVADGKKNDGGGKCHKVKL